MSSTPAYASTANLGFNTIASANVSTTVFTAGASGSITETIRVKCNDSSSHYKLQVYVGYNPSGFFGVLATEIEIKPVIVDDVTPSYEIELPLKLSLPTTYLIKVVSPKAESVNVIISGADF